MMATASSAPSDGWTCVLVDVHTHLTDHVFEKDIDSVINRAKEQGVGAALAVTEGQDDIALVLGLQDRYPDFILPCLGLHPLQLTDEQDGTCGREHRSITMQDYEGFEERVVESANRIAAIGEVGLDFTPRFIKSPEDKDIQKLMLTRQAKLAEKLNLPLNVHSRSAGKHAIQLLKECGARNVLFHAFDGRASTAMEGVACGFSFSVTAAVCRDPQTEKLVRTLPLDHLMLETDSPAIAPVKATRNEPANVAIACEHIARIKKMDVAEVRRITTENAVRLFPKLKDILSS